MGKKKRKRAFKEAFESLAANSKRCEGKVVFQHEKPGDIFDRTSKFE